MVSEKSNFVKQVSHSKNARLGTKRKRKDKAAPPARRYWLDIGKNISLALMAAKYDQADAGGDGAQ